MSKYAIMRFKKYKVGSVAKLERHQQHRGHLTNRAHPEQVDKNRTWKRYNETMSRTVRKAIKEQEKNGNAYVIRPEIPLEAGHIEHDADVLERTYQAGRTAGMKHLENVIKFTQKSDE